MEGYIELFQRHRCLIESDTRVPRAAFTTEKSRITQILSTIDRAADKRTAAGVCQAAAPSPTPTPTVALSPPTFTFDRLVVTGARGHARTTFRVGEDVRIVASYTVRNLPAGTILNGTMVRLIEVPVGGRFQKVVRNSDTLAVARSGTYQNVHDTGGFSRASAIRIVVRLRFGVMSRARHVDIQVR
jgi:hypothetical protein